MVGVRGIISSFEEESGHTVGGGLQAYQCQMGCYLDGTSSSRAHVPVIDLGLLVTSCRMVDETQSNLETSNNEGPKAESGDAKRGVFFRFKVPGVAVSRLGMSWVSNVFLSRRSRDKLWWCEYYVYLRTRADRNHHGIGETQIPERISILRAKTLGGALAEIVHDDMGAVI